MAATAGSLGFRHRGSSLTGSEPSANVTYSNGTKKAMKVLKSDVKWYDSHHDNVIAIDFGTSTLTVAYQMDGGEVFSLPIQEDIRCIPTILLIRRDGTVEIGGKALSQYSRQEVDISSTIFFEKVKLELQHNMDITLRSYVRGSDGKPYYLIEVIALILKKVKQRIQQYFETRGGAYTTENFSWVLTVPALWGERARNMMREAAYLAGLCSERAEDDDILTLPLKTSLEHNPPDVGQYEENPERLSLVFEPEAAAAWCMNLSLYDVRDTSNMSESLSTEECFLTVDVGGGTIDITAHQMDVDKKMYVFNLPHGKVYGGSLVNEAFMTFLDDKIGNGSHKYFLSAPDGRLRKADFQALKNEEFENAKKRFAEDEDRDYYTVRLPVPYVKEYRHRLERYQQTIEDGASLQYIDRVQQLRISKATMKDLMMGCLFQIKECIDNAIEFIKRDPKILYLVGGFGGCQCVARYIRDAYKDQGIRVIIPHNPDLAVVRGACLYFKNKPIRMADATYGTACKLPYNEDNPVHRQGERVAGTDRDYCKSLFKPFVHVEEHLDPNYAYKTYYSPIREDQETMRLILYSLKERYADFVEVNGEMHPEMRMLGWLIIDLTTMLDLPMDQRQVELLIDFSSVEITINAHYIDHRVEKRLKTTTDFLSTKEKLEDFTSLQE